MLLLSLLFIPAAAAKDPTIDELRRVCVADNTTDQMNCEAYLRGVGERLQTQKIYFDKSCRKTLLAQMLYNSGTLSGNKAFSDAIKNDDGVSASAAVEDFLNQSAGNKKTVREAHPEVERRMYEGLDKLFPQKEEEE